MGTLGVVMAAVNYLVATYLSKDMWLYYTSFGDFVLSMVMVFAVIKYATIEER
jgi:intracellular septation protein A